MDKINGVAFNYFGSKILGAFDSNVANICFYPNSRYEFVFEVYWPFCFRRAAIFQTPF